MKKRAFLFVVPVSLLAAACTNTSSTSTASTDQVKFVAGAGDNAPKSEHFAEGYEALKTANYTEARQELSVATNEMPANPYASLDLGAAYQNTGYVNRAVPLYRDAIARGGDIYPADTTTSDTKGMTLAEIAKRNLALAGLDANGNSLTKTVSSSSLEAQRSYQVFFDFDKSDITASASQVIAQAAATVKSGGFAQIKVTGHTDTVGSAQYNQGLSERRALAVKQTLVADGVPDESISARGVGKNGLLVPTGDGVREPQNRRAEIMLDNAKTAMNQ